MPKITPKIARCACGLEFGTAEGLCAHLSAMQLLPHARPVVGQTPALVIDALPQPVNRRPRTLGEILS